MRKYTHARPSRLGSLTAIMSLVVTIAWLPLPAHAQILVQGNAVACNTANQGYNWAESSCVRWIDGPDDNFVMSVQAILNRFGYFASGLPYTTGSCASTSTSYASVVIGNFGSCTDGAVKNFQWGHTLVSDGAVGYSTWDFLQAGHLEEPHAPTQACREGWTTAARTEPIPPDTNCAFSASSHPRPYIQDYRWGNYWAFWHITSGCWTWVSYQHGACKEFAW